MTAPEESADDVDVAALLVGMKRARRTGEWDAFGRLALRLHEVTRDAETELREASRRLDYAEYGGAPLIGLDGVAIIAHGGSNPRATSISTSGSV